MSWTAGSFREAEACQMMAADALQRRIRMPGDGCGSLVDSCVRVNHWRDPNGCCFTPKGSHGLCAIIPITLHKLATATVSELKASVTRPTLRCEMRGPLNSPLRTGMALSRQTLTVAP